MTIKFFRQSFFEILVFWVLLSILLIPAMGLAQERLVVKDSSGTTSTFTVNARGGVYCAFSFRANDGPVWGSAPLVMGQDVGNRGLIVSDKGYDGATNNAYLGWNTSDLSYFEINAVEEGVAFRDIIMNPQGGRVIVRGTEADFQSSALFQVGTPGADGGAYCDGFSWQPVSSRESKKDIQELNTDDALKALKDLTPVSFKYKQDKSNELRLGFIAEDVPDLVASSNRKTMDPMDVVALLTKVVKQQQDTIDKLSEKIDKLEKSN